VPAKLQEKANKNRQDPYPSPKIIKGKIEPNVQKTPKGIGGEKKKSEAARKQEALIYKQIFDSQLGRNVKHTGS